MNVDHICLQYLKKENIFYESSMSRNINFRTGQFKTVIAFVIYPRNTHSLRRGAILLGIELVAWAQHKHPKTQKLETLGWLQYKNSCGLLNCRDPCGILFSTCTAMCKAAIQNFFGIDELSNKVQTEFKRVRCILFTQPFCCGVCGQENRGIIPDALNKCSNFL